MAGHRFWLTLHASGKEEMINISEADKQEVCPGKPRFLLPIYLPKLSYISMAHPGLPAGWDRLGQPGVGLIL